MNDLFMCYASHEEQRDYIKSQIIYYLNQGVPMTNALLEKIVCQTPDLFSSAEVQEIVNEVKNIY